MSPAETVSWSGFLAEAPALARTAQQILESHPHHVIATTKRDGSPRVGGTNVFITQGELWIGAMSSALRNQDLRRNPRCAIHSAPLDEHLQVGDIRLDLEARELVGEAASSALLSVGNEGEGVVFAMKIVSASLARVEKNQLVIETWNPVTGCRSAHLR